MKNHVLWKATSVLTGLLFSGLSFASAPEAVPGEYLVKMKTPVDQKSFTMLSSILGGQVLRTIPGTNIVVLKRSVLEKSVNVAKTLSQVSEVEIAEPNYIYRASAMPNDPEYQKLWGMNNVGQADSSNVIGTAGIDIDAQRAWDIQTGSKEIVVAVIDTGLDYSHADLAENVWTNDAEANGKPGIDDDKNGYVDDIHGYDFVNNDGDPMDDHGHGSHCAGTIGAKGNDGKGIVGVAWNVKIMGLKFLSASGSGSTEDAIRAIDYGTKMGARILSNSWGGGGYSELLKEAVARSHAANASFIAAAGNSSTNNDTSPSYPANYDVPNVVSVAAINNKGGLASFSSYGKRTVHVAAPGVNIYSSIPQGYDSWSGTSMATPHVSGVAALLAANERAISGAEIKERLMKTARPLASIKSKVSSGGVVNAFFALTNKQAPPDPNDPALWPNKMNLAISSEHPYKDKTSAEWEISIPGAKQVALFFENFETELNYDKVTFYDAKGVKIGQMHGGASGSWSETFNTDYIKMVFKSDDSVSKHGFDLTKAAWK